MDIIVRPIGIMKSVFHFKNGTPRQSSLCDGARGIITIEKNVFNNPEHSLIGLEEFSHAWIIFLFHKSNNHTKAKVKPPRLNGRKVGVFSSRSPYRPNNIGLSLVKIDKIEGASVHVSGIDILDGTPVIDIKPYIPDYDKPKEEHILSMCDNSPSYNQIATDITNVSCADNCIDSSLTYQIQDSLNISSVDQTNQEANICAALSSGCINENSIAATESLQFSNATTETANSCFQHQLLENQSLNAFSFQNADNREYIDSISEGFYAVSAALEKAKEKLCGVACKSTLDSLHSSDNQPVSYSSKYQPFNSGLVDEGNDNVDILLNSALSKTDFQQSHTHSLPDFSGNLFSLPVLVNVCESGVCDMGMSASNNQTKTECIADLSDSESTRTSSKVHTTVASWLLNPPVSKLKVNFTLQALEQLQKFSKQSNDSRYQFHLFSSIEEAHKSISDILREEPRSVYRRQHFQDSLYYFAVDVLHVTCWFDEGTAQVVRIKPVASVPKLHSQN